MRFRWAMVVVFIALLGGTYFVYTRLPQSFLPEEDPGYFIAVVQAPAGASLEYTSNVAKEAEQIMMAVPGGGGRLLDHGFQLHRQRAEPGTDLRGAETVRPAARRRASAAGDPRRGCADSCSASRTRFVIPFAPPSIQGLGAFGGFTFEVLDQGGGAEHPESWRCRVRTDRRIAGSRPQVTGLFSAFTANDPQLAVDIDREKAQKPRPADQRDHERDADLSRLVVRERLRFQQPRVSRVRAGGQGVIGRIRSRSASTTRGPTAVRWCRLPASCACARRPRRR